MMRAGSWRSLTIATGEIPIVGDSTQQSAANRTLEISAEPFDDVCEAQAMHHLVAAQHGTAGRAFVEALRRNPRAHPREGPWRGFAETLRRVAFPQPCGSRDGLTGRFSPRRRARSMSRRRAA